MNRSASQVLSAYLLKAAGDRGGHVIGTTAGGHPIYASTKGDAASYYHFSARDHASAAAMHDAASSRAPTRREAAHHAAMATSHRVRYEAVRDKEGLRRPQSKAGVGHAAAHMADNPRPEDGHEVGKVFTGRAVYANRQPHEYHGATASEHGEISRVHEAAAHRARAAGDHVAAAAHGAMRHAHVQATIAANRAEASLRGHDRPHFRGRMAERRVSA